MLIMPYECLVDETNELILIRLTGVVTGNDLIEAKQAQLKSTVFGPGARIIWDGTGIEQLILSPPDIQSIRQLVALHEGVEGTGRTAIVAKRKVDRAAAWLFVHIARRVGWPAEVVSSMDEALDYLGLDEADILVR